MDLPRRGNLTFEPLAERHAPLLEELTRDADVVRFTYVPDPPPPDFGLDWAGRYADPEREETGWAAFDGDGRFAGVGLVPTLNRERGEAEIGYIVAPAARGRGFAGEILAAATEWTFEQGIVRIELFVDVDNAPSLRVAERAGYRREGVMRSAYFKQGLRTDLVLLARLADD